VWHVGELARSASETTGRSYTSQAASWALKALARDGLVERTHNNREAPWRYTQAGEAKARELGYLQDERA